MLLLKTTHIFLKSIQKYDNNLEKHTLIQHKTKWKILKNIDEIHQK